MKRGEVVGKQKFNNLNKVSKKTYSEVMKEYLNQLKIKGRSIYTIRSCKYHSRYFLEFLGKDVYCYNITEKTLEDYIVYLQDIRKITNGVTINSYIRNISPILKYAMKKGYILDEFMIPQVKEQEVIKEIYTQEELKTLLEKPKKRDFVEIRTWAVLWTLASTGVRARELRELKVKNVDLLNRTIVVNKTKNKKARYLPISNSLAEVLTEYLEVRGQAGNIEDYLFCTVYNTQLAMSSLQVAVKKYCNARGIEKTSLHLFRHTFITNAVNKNVSPLVLKRITGHTTLKELNRYYNAKTVDLIDVIDDITPKSNKKESYFKMRR